MAWAAAKYGDQALLVTGFSGDAGRDWITQSPARGDNHLVQERGRRQQRTPCELLFTDQPGRGDYLERWLAFRELASRTTPSLFVHPFDGSYLAVVAELQYQVQKRERAVRATCAFVAVAALQAVVPSGAGVVPQAGSAAVDTAADKAATTLAAAGVSSSLPADCQAAVEAWAAAETPEARAIQVEAASLASQLDELLDTAELATDLDRWEAYRAVISLRAEVTRAAAAVTSETSQVYSYTVAVAEPLRTLVARLYGASNAAERTAQVQRLNGLRTPGRVPAGTVLSLPVVRDL